jgi:lysophospholipase L1-like esterase
LILAFCSALAVGLLFAGTFKYLIQRARVGPSLLGSLIISIVFLYLVCALIFLKMDGIQFVIGVATYLVLLVLLLVEVLLRTLDKLDAVESNTSDDTLVDSNGTQLKAAAFYNSFEYISRLESAKLDENLSREFWDELSAYRNRGMFARDSDKIIIGNADVDGKFINVINGLRQTPGHPTDYLRSIHLFGGSTIFAYEVTDEHTPSALLQKQINETGSKIAVFNYGVGGSTIGDCLRRLKLVSLAKDDIVLFLFGDNDIGINSPRKLVSRGVFKLIPFWGNLLLVSKSHSRMFKWLFFETVEYRFTDLETNPDLLRKTLEDYFRIWEYLKSLNICVCFLLQPNIYTKEPINEFEHRLKSTYPKHWERTVASGFKMLQDSLKDKADFLDISSVFDNKSGSYYLDWAHVNSSGNKIIADEMFKVLKHKELI